MEQEPRPQKQTEAVAARIQPGARDKTNHAGDEGTRDRRARPPAGTPDTVLLAGLRQQVLAAAPTHGSAEPHLEPRPSTPKSPLVPRSPGFHLDLTASRYEWLNTAPRAPTGASGRVLCVTARDAGLTGSQGEGAGRTRPVQKEARRRQARVLLSTRGPAERCTAAPTGVMCFEHIETCPRRHPPNSVLTTMERGVFEVYGGGGSGNLKPRLLKVSASFVGMVSQL